MITCSTASGINRSRDEDIAIVGMACLVPGADTAARFWQNIVHAVDRVTPAPPEWQPELFADLSGNDADRVYTDRGGYLGDVCRFDPLKYGVMPASVDGAEPDQFLALRCAFEAVADAGYPEVPLNCQRTGVILGRGTFFNRGYVSLLNHCLVLDQLVRLLGQLEAQRSAEELAELKAELKRQLPPLNADIVPGLAHAVLVGRIANRLDLKGPAYTVDAACTSSLIAVERAVEELHSGRCDAVLAGGVQVSTVAMISLLFCHLKALSRTGRIAPFSADADGTLLGQGCGVVVLKRLADARRDGNRIYALLKSVGVSSDGTGAGLLAPRQEGQELALRRAYEQAGISPDSIGLIEAHGTGIPLGDATEMATLRSVFGGRRPGGASVALGTVKSMIGHLIPAAGVASLIKTALALYHRVLPPTLHAEQAHAKLELDHTPFYLSRQTRPWIHGDPQTPRRAGINAFGFGGLNAHAILQEHCPDEEHATPSLELEWPSELVVISAEDQAALLRRAADLAAWIERAEPVRLLDIAASCAAHEGPSRAAICASSTADLLHKLRYVAEQLGKTSRTKIQHRNGVFWYQQPMARQGKLAFVFPGEGSQYLNMLAELCRHFPEVRREFDLTDRAFLRSGSPWLPSRVIFPIPEEREKAEAELFHMAEAVESVTTADRALLSLLGRLGVRPAAVVGHSSGEFAALLAAGAVEFPADKADEALVQCIADGARCAAEIFGSGSAKPTVLIAVGGAKIEAVEQVVADAGGRLVVAMDNCPHQMILAGDEESAAAAADQLRRQGALCNRLPWDRAYHTPGFTEACQSLQRYFSGLPMRPPRVELWSCAIQAPYPGDVEGVRELAARQWRTPVRFRGTIRKMHEAGIRLFLEVGPRGNLTAFIDDILADVPHVALAMDVPSKGGIEQLCRTMGMLAAQGVPCRLQGLYERRRPVPLDFTHDPPKASPAPILRLDLPNLALDAAAAQKFSFRPPQKHPAAPLLATAAAAPPSPAAATAVPDAEDGAATGAVRKTAPTSVRGERSRVFADCQQTMREFLELQQRVMSGGLWEPASPPERAVDHLSTGRGGAQAITPQSPPAAPDARQAAASGEYPMLDNILSLVEGQKLVAQCELDLSRHPFLRHHTFGRQVSLHDPSLTGLPVMPLAMSIEVLVEAAARLRPDLRVAAVCNVEGVRWLAVEQASRLIQVEATARGDYSIQAALYEVVDGAAGKLVARASVEMSDDADSSLGAATLRVQADQPSTWRPKDLYTRGLFSGPAFQALQSIDGISEQGLRATIQSPPAELLPGPLARQLRTPVALVDGVGQLTGFYVAEKDLIMAFPVGIKRLEFAPAALSPARQPLSVVARMTEVEPGTWNTDIEVCDLNRQVVMRALGRTHRVVDVPAHIWRYWVNPQALIFSRPLDELFQGLPEVEQIAICGLDSFHTDCFLESSGFWAAVLARLILSGEERRAYGELKRPSAAMAAWLFGRAVAKDAVRRLLPLDLCMADVPIATGSNGQPVAAPPSGKVLVSLAHKGMDAVAVAGDAEHWDGLGIDLEWASEPPAELTEDAFLPEERQRLDSAAREGGEDAGLAYVSAWAAKEAVGKALGRGLLGGPRSLEIVSCEPGLRRFIVALRGPTLEACRELAGGADPPAQLAAEVRRDGSRVIALCTARWSIGLGSASGRTQQGDTGFSGVPSREKTSVP